MLEWLWDNRDFLVFAALALLAFGAEELWLRRTGRGGLPGLVWILIVTILAVSWFPTSSAGDRQERAARGMAETLARHYASELEKLGHARVTAETPPGDPLHLAITDARREWLAANPLVQGIYTMRQTPRGDIAVIAGGEIGAQPASRPFSEEAAHSAGLATALRGGQTVDRLPPARDRAPLVRAWAPIRDASGKIDAALRVDYNATANLEAAMVARHHVLALVALPLLILLGASAFSAMQRHEMATRAKAGAVLREAERRFHSFMDNSPAVAFLKDGEGRYLFGNHGLEMLYQKTLAEIVGKRDHDLLPPEVAKRIMEVDDRVRQEGRSIELHESVPTADGEMREWWVCKFPVADESSPGTVGGMAIDVTEKMRLEEELRHSQKLQTVGQLASGIAHDFNNLLTVIVGCSDVLKDPSIPRTEVIEHAQRSGDAADRAATLVRQLLAFSRRQVLIPRETHVNSLIEKLEHVLRRALGDHIEFMLQRGDAIPPIFADPAMIEQTLVNLALNSCDAMPLGGTFTVTTARVELDEEAGKHHPEARAGSFVRITVRDTGFGMDVATLGRLFEPFFTTKDVGKGAGMGLATVYGIVKQHEGWIEVRSAPGAGTTFYVFLPAMAAAVAKPERAPARLTLPELDRGVILLVEDDNDVRFMVKRLLTHAGYRVREAVSGAKALPVWEEHQDEISLLFTDMVMPDGVSGKDLAERFRAVRPDLRVIFTSGYSADMLDPHLLKHPGTRFLQKPFGPRDLKEIVDELFHAGPALVA